MLVRLIPYNEEGQIIEDKIIASNSTDPAKGGVLSQSIDPNFAGIDLKNTLRFKPAKKLMSNTKYVI